MQYTALVVNHSLQYCDRLVRVAAETGLFAKIIPCHDKAQALDYLERESVDLLLWDWRPETSQKGRELFQYLKMHEKWADIPIFSLTAETDEEQQVLAIESGADDCICYNGSHRRIATKMQQHLLRKLRFDEMRRTQQDLEKKAVTDSLTGLYNRGFFNASLEREMARCQRTGLPFSLMLIDLDHFKVINDRFGHPMGDRVLQAVAVTLQGATRFSDTVCRFGGEEFAIILPETPAAGAGKVAERIRHRISALTALFDMHRLTVSASIGISNWEGSREINAFQLLNEADSALYDSKRKGRDRTILFRPRQPMHCLESLPPYPQISAGYA